MIDYTSLDAAIEAATAMGYDSGYVHALSMSVMDAFDDSPMEDVEQVMVDRFALFRPHIVESESEPDPLIRAAFVKWEITADTLDECLALRRDGIPDELIAALYGLDLFAPLPTFPGRYQGCGMSDVLPFPEDDTPTPSRSPGKIIGWLTPARWRR